MNEFGMNPSNTDTVRRWMAECENADARLELARVRECCKLLVSQYDPVASLGIDRERLAVLLDFVQHHDTSRLRREADALVDIANSPICVEADGGESPPACEDYLGEAMDYIIDQIGWADKFPRQCHDRIRKVCEAVKRAEPLPFKPNNRIQA